jgi:unsaturated rhamnogalacturonyl hydrolase
MRVSFCVSAFALLSIVPPFFAADTEKAASIRSAIGVTRAGTAIPCLISEADLKPGTTPHRVLLVGGWEGRGESTQAVLAALQAPQASTPQTLSLSAVPTVRPDPTGDPLTALSFPPTGNAYHQPENDVAHYLWRWIGMHAPDAVILVAKESDPSAASLAQALGKSAPCGMGTIPCRVVAPADLPRALVAAAQSPQPSPAHLEKQRRLRRSALEIATELAQVYGHKLDPVAYIPALAIVGRMRLGELTRDDSALRDAEKIGQPYTTGDKESMPSNGNGSTLSGHLVFAELARRTGDPGWTALVKKAADYGFDSQGQPKESMPFHSEMSDSVFMGCAILAEAGALTGEKKYFEHCLRHLRFMEERCLRSDGLYRHSPLDESAWGRGNGFPALGLSLSLSHCPAIPPSTPPSSPATAPT